MEAATISAKATGASPLVALQRFLSKYGLIIVLLALPVAFGVHDIVSGEGLSHIIQNLKDGVSNGAIWALVAIGYTLVYGIIELINFAHGDVFMIGSFIAVGLWGTFGLTESTGAGGLFIGLLGCLVDQLVAGAELLS